MKKFVFNSEEEKEFCYMNIKMMIVEEEGYMGEDELNRIADRIFEAIFQQEF